MIIWDLHVAEGQDKNNVKKMKRRNYQEGLVPNFVYIVSSLIITLKICTCMLIL